jgi:alpha-glucosidase
MSRSPEEEGDAEAWWRWGVLYQIYPRSFADSNGDGHGDLQGLIEHLDHLAWLGVDGVWLNPITPSPNADWGYDVTDYASVDPIFGQLDTLDRLFVEAGDRGIRVILDVVPNHTSDRHPWFMDARSDRAARHRDWYVWSDGKPDGSPPNNWLSVFGGPAWTRDGLTGQYYLHNFLPEQPDLNWWNEEVREAFDEILRFWLDRGVAGFRIDVANGLVKDPSLRDNPAVTDQDHPRVRSLGLRPVYNMNQAEVHDLLRRWRRIADSYQPPRVLVGETWVLDLEALVRFYGSGSDELHLAQNFPFIFAEFGSEARGIVDRTQAMFPPSAWPVWAGSNHDVGRFPTRWCRGDERRIRAALLALLTLRGTPLLYYGDEIGMPEVEVPADRVLDRSGRDAGRTPMPWSNEPGGGFTPPGVEPWLPMGDPASCNVADQRRDPGSVLHLCRDLIALRRARPDLTTGAYDSIDAPDGVWAWRRGDHTVVAVNCSDAAAQADLGAGDLLLGTRPRPGRRGGQPVGGPLDLEPWEAVVLSRRI